MKIPLLSVIASAFLWTNIAPSAQADTISCDKAAKKLEWHMCVLENVEYKRGLKTDKRMECAVDKKLKTKSACNLGNLFDHIPEGVDHQMVRFYAIGPKDMDTRGYERQRVGENHEICGVNDSTLSLYSLMKFSAAFDQDNRGRGEMVKAKLAKKKKEVFRGNVLGVAKCEGKRETILGWIDKKSQSKFLIYAEGNHP